MGAGAAQAMAMITLRFPLDAADHLQDVPWRRARALPERKVLGHPTEANIGGYGGSIQPRSEPAGRDQRLGLGCEGEAERARGDVERLYTKAVAGEKGSPLLGIPNDECEHSVEPLDEGQSMLLVQMYDDLRVRARPKDVALFAIGPKLDEVVDLPIEEDANAAGFVEDRLLSAFDVDNGQPRHARRDSGLEQQPFAVRPPVGDRPQGSAHRLRFSDEAGVINMNVLSVTAHPSPERAKALGVKFVDLDTLLSESDIVTLHVPLTPETEHMIGARELAKMKPTAILINTARGKVVDEDALIEALRDKKIAGAGLDVFEREPLAMNSPLLEMDNVLLTPHIAFLSEESLDECTYMSIENVEMFIKGTPQNVVNPSVSNG